VHTVSQGEPTTFTRVVTFRRLEFVSCFHSCVYLSLLICAFALHKPEPATFILGLSHGLIVDRDVAALHRRNALACYPFLVGRDGCGAGAGSGRSWARIGFIYETRRRARVLSGPRPLPYEDGSLNGR